MLSTPNGTTRVIGLSGKLRRLTGRRGAINSTAAERGDQVSQVIQRGRLGLAQSHYRVRYRAY